MILTLFFCILNYYICEIAVLKEKFAKIIFGMVSQGSVPSRVVLWNLALFTVLVQIRLKSLD